MPLDPSITIKISDNPSNINLKVSSSDTSGRKKRRNNSSEKEILDVTY